MKILIFNWRDIKNPWAGGAELNYHEQAKIWIKLGHEVTLFCGSFQGAKSFEVIDGINVYRKGSRFTVYIWAVIYYLIMPVLQRPLPMCGKPRLMIGHGCMALM